MKEEEIPERGNYFAAIKLSSILSFFLYLVTAIVFFFLLNAKTGSGFGFVEILFSLIVAIFATLFLIWLKKFMKSRPYLGSALGLLVLFFAEYSLLIRYSGPNTTVFAVIIAVITIAFITFFFLKYRNSSHKEENKEFNDNI